LVDLGREDPEAKVIVFASFRATIRYLRKRLEQDGVAHQWIHGGVSMDPIDPGRDVRGNRVRKFLEDPKYRVLISSNVGGEGLDLQRASVVINYDLPWNPALVEQRIGRIDRFGQERKVIHVLNMILPGTVEDLVFTRLINRLHLFEETLGDLAEVLGPLVADLSSEFLSQDLSESQKERRLREAEQRGKQLVKDRAELLSRENEYIAYDEDFSDRLKGFESTGQTIRPDELVEVCHGVMAQHFPAAYLRPAFGEPNEDLRAIYDLYLDFELIEVLKRRVRAEPSSVLHRFMARVPEGSPRRVTFDGEVAEKQLGVLLLTTRHPFVRELIRHGQSAELFHSVSAIGVPKATLPESRDGLLVLFQAQLEFGPQTRRYLLPLFATREHGIRPELESRKILRKALDSGESASGEEAPPGEELVVMFRDAWDAAEKHLEELANRLMERETRRVQPRVAELRTRYDRRISNATERRQEALRDEDEDRAKRMDAYRKRLNREKDRKIEDLQRLPDPEEEILPVGATWIRAT
jgi:hypothetical protein